MVHKFAVQPGQNSAHSKWNARAAEQGRMSSHHFLTLNPEETLPSLGWLGTSLMSKQKIGKEINFNDFYPCVTARTGWKH